MLSKSPLPPPRRQLAMEIERYQRKLQEIGLKQSDRSYVYADIVQCTELYHLATGESYKRILDVTNAEKFTLSRMFLR